MIPCPTHGFSPKVAIVNGTVSPRGRRSRITKGSKLLPTVNQSSVWGRIMGDVLDAVIARCGGEGQISELQRLPGPPHPALEAELIHLEDKIASTRLAGEEPSHHCR